MTGWGASLTFTARVRHLSALVWIGIYLVPEWQAVYKGVPSEDKALFSPLLFEGFLQGPGPIL
jgi:hypothetical protein